MSQNPTTPEEAKPAAEPTPPMGQAPTPPAAPVGPKKSKTGLIIGLVSGGVLLIAGITVLVLFLTVWSHPSQADYEEADDAMSDVRSSYEDSSKEFASFSRVSPSRSSQFSRPGSTDTSSSSSSRDALNKALDKYKEDVESLESLKAMSDKDVKDAYDTFKEKNDKFLKYVDDLSGAVEANKACSSVGTFRPTGSDADAIVEQYDEAMRPCNEAIEKLKDADNEDVARYANDLSGGIEKMRSALDAVVKAAEAKDRSALMQAQRQLNEGATEARNADRTANSSFRKANKEASVKDELQKLRDVIHDKAKGNKND